MCYLNMDRLFNIILVFLIITKTVRAKDKIKRLLLSDPDVVQHRLDIMDAKIQELTRKIEQQESKVSDGKSTYVRWGKNSCGNSSTLVYSGMVGGTSSDSTGGAANPLCMVHDVIWGTRNGEGHMAEIHGAEYQDNFWGPGSLDKDVPCAVCKPNDRSTVLMMPGRNKCLNRWTEEYHGYLSADYVSHHHTSTYICVDENVDYLDGGIESNEGYLLYGVRAHCGSLKCPPYVEGKPVTCVVCSQ